MMRYRGLTTKSGKPAGAAATAVASAAMGRAVCLGGGWWRLSGVEVGGAAHWQARAMGRVFNVL
jgi:hypothetical protein